MLESKKDSDEYMSSVISNAKLLKLLEDPAVIINGKPESCRGMKYDFTLSSRFLKAKSKVELNFNELSPDEKTEYAVIKPGEVIYVLTEEKVKMPRDIYAQLTPKRNMGELGINVQGALFIDPQYEGVLVFGLYNYSSTDFHFTPGKAFASAVFYQLDENETVDYNRGKEPKKIEGFSQELINTIYKYEPSGFSNLSERMVNVESHLKEIDNKLEDNDRWYNDIKRVLNQVSEQNLSNTNNISTLQFSINELKESLSNECNNRKSEDLEIKNSILKSDQKSKILTGVFCFFIFILGAGVSLLIAWLSGLFK